MKSMLKYLIVLSIPTISTAQEPACVGIMLDEVCITKTFPTCTATWNGVPCESCTICGDEEDAATAYRCEVASLVGSGECSNTCSNVECNAGCAGCRISGEEAIADAIAEYELQQQQQEETESVPAGVEGTYPVPAGGFTNAPTNDTSVIPVVIDNNTNEAILEEDEQEEDMEDITEEEESQNTTTTEDEQAPGLDTQSDAGESSEGNAAPSESETAEEQTAEEDSSGSAPARTGSGTATLFLALSSLLVM